MDIHPFYICSLPNYGLSPTPMETLLPPVLRSLPHVTLEIYYYKMKNSTYGHISRSDIIINKEKHLEFIMYYMNKFLSFGVFLRLPRQ